MQLFYGTRSGDKFTLAEDESKHAVKVLRKVEGDVLHAMDGEGNLIEGIISLAHPKRCELAIQQVTPRWGEVPYRLHLAFAPTKNMDRTEWLIEKAIELGVDRFTPLLTEHSERKVLKVDRLDRIARSACKQSLKGTLPKIDELTPFDEFIRSEQTAHRYIGYCGDGTKAQLIQELRRTSEPVCIAIGPEGDFSPREFEEAVAQGFKGITLGDQRLRTETAGLMAVHTAHVAHLLRSEGTN